MNSNTQKNKKHTGVALPKWAIPIAWFVIVLIIMVLLPWAISRFGPRYGWSDQTPAIWNLIGLIAVAIGLSIYAWCLVFHFKSYKTSVHLGFTPPHLVSDGPYRFSRNPMYFSGLVTWFGWTIFFGSPANLAGLVLLWAIFTFRVIPYEEHQLEDLFGEEYVAYKHSVHRWAGNTPQK